MARVPHDDLLRSDGFLAAVVEGARARMDQVEDLLNRVQEMIEGGSRVTSGRVAGRKPGRPVNTEAAAPEKARKKTTWTPAMKKAAGERMKARWKAKLTAASKPTKRSKKTAATPKQESEGQI